MTDTTDIAIVGAGIFGLATAHALCRDGAGRVTLLDRGLPASGDSGRSFSMVRRHYSNAVTARLAIAGSRTIMRWSDEVGVADAGYVRCGYLLTVPERLVEACRGNVELLQGLGLDTRFLEPGEIAAAEPELSLEGVAGAAYEPDGGFADAQKMCLGWYAAASGNGLDGRLGTDVTAIRVENGRVQGVETSRGFLAADRVVLATGAWGNDLLRPLGAEQPIALRRLQVAVLRQPIGAPLPTAVCSDAVTNVVVRPDRGQQFYAVAYFGDEPLERADDCDNGISDGYEDVVRRAVARALPAARRLRARARLRRPVRLVARLEPDHRPVPWHRGPLPRARLVRPRLQAVARGRRGGRRGGGRTHAADRRHRPAPDPVRRGQAAAPRVRPRRARLTVRTAGVVLAGGRSRRMGTPKAALPWGATTLLGARLRARRARRWTGR